MDPLALFVLIICAGLLPLGALLVPDVGERTLLDEMLSNGQDWELRLFQNDVTPAEGDTLATYTEATFTGYAMQTLTRSQTGSTWAAAATNAGVTSSEYNSGTPRTWTNTGSAQTIYGYYYESATANLLQLAERFASSRTLNTSDTLNVTPRIELD